MHYVYILYSKKLKKKYIGSTGNIKDRFKDHLTGKVTFTSKAADWKLIYYEAFLSKADALVEERFLKSGKGRERLKYLLVDTTKLIDN